jgi:hypothetical protein
VSFQFGTSTAYGQSTAAQRIAPATASTPFSAQLAGLPAGTTIHYRAVAASDFGTFTGADQTLVTAPAPPAPPVAVSAGRASVVHVSTSGGKAKARVTCSGQTGATCRLVLRLTVTETRHGKAARHHARHVVLVGRTSVVLAAGQSRTVTVALNRAGKRLLGHHRLLRTRLSVQQLGAVAATVPSAVVTFHRHGR